MSNKSIPSDTGKVKQPEGDTPEQTEYLPQITNRLFSLLQGDHRLRKRHKTLHQNGSFYGTNERYAKEMKVSISTIIRSKKRLAAAKKIKYITHQGRGMATVYWILPPPDTIPTTKNNQSDSTTTDLSQSLRTCARLFGHAHTIQFFLEQGIPETDIKAHLRA